MDFPKVKRLVELDTPTAANGLELLGVRDPSIGYTGPDIRALTPDLGRRAGIAVTARLDTTTVCGLFALELVVTKCFLRMNSMSNILRTIPSPQSPKSYPAYRETVCPDGQQIR